MPTCSAGWRLPSSHVGPDGLRPSYDRPLGGDREDDAIDDDLLWYVSYGSNLSAARFGCYLHGGTPDGGRRRMVGCRDGRPARAWRAVEVEHALHFGGPSPTWGGGPAFLDTTRSGRVLARAWLIARQQFDDLVAQENHLDVGTVTVDDDVLANGGVAIAGGSYGRLVRLPDIEAVPAVTFTYLQRPAPRAPAPAYLALLRRGLAEIGHAREAVEAYLSPWSAATSPEPGAP